MWSDMDIPEGSAWFKRDCRERVAAVNNAYQALSLAAEECAAVMISHGFVDERALPCAPTKQAMCAFLAEYVVEAMRENEGLGGLEAREMAE